MDNYDCPSKYCFYNSKYEFCKCKRATKSGSAATVQNCQIYIRIMKEKEFKQKAMKLMAETFGGLIYDVNEGFTRNPS